MPVPGLGDQFAAYLAALGERVDVGGLRRRPSDRRRWDWQGDSP
ncbi:hypothetical protein ACIF6L_31835 [Kitasatospora sp. NPDC086009]